MSQPTTTPKMVQWTVSVPEDLDADVRTFMTDFKFGEKMNMSQLLDQALSHYMMLLVTQKMRELPSASMQSDSTK